jgi:hypothetical protein
MKQNSFYVLSCTSVAILKLIFIIKYFFGTSQEKGVHASIRILNLRFISQEKTAPVPEFGHK